MSPQQGLAPPATPTDQVDENTFRINSREKVRKSDTKTENFAAALFFHGGIIGQHQQALRRFIIIRRRTNCNRSRFMLSRARGFHLPGPHRIDFNNVLWN
jgi:hypothetical protein